MEFHKPHASASSGARGSTDQISQPDETSMAQRSTPDLVLWSDEPGGVLEPAQEERKEGQRQERSHRTHELSHTQVSEIGAAAACEPEPQTIHITDNPTENQSSRSSWPTPVFCRTHQARSCSPSWTCWTFALGMMAAISVEEKRGRLRT